MATSLVLTTFVLHTVVLTVTQVAGTFDVSVVSMTRTVSKDKTRMTLTAEFTASEKPQVAFRNYYNALPGSTVTYAAGRGTASLTTPVKPSTIIFMRIGKFDIQYLDVQMSLESRFMNKVSVTQMLNTRPSTVSPGTDIAYSPGTSFDVMVTFDTKPADKFVRPSSRDLKLTSTYLDPASGEVVRSWSFPSVGNFLTVNKTFNKGNPQGTLELSFSAAKNPVYGFFKIDTTSSYSAEVSKDDHFVTDLNEYIILTVHEYTTPGPFPSCFKYVKATTFPSPCSANMASCIVKCAGSSNDLKSLDVLKVETDGTQTHLSKKPEVLNSGKYYSEILTPSLKPNESTTGQFVCKVTSRDGSSATNTVTLFRN